MKEIIKYLQRDHDKTIFDDVMLDTNDKRRLYLKGIMDCQDDCLNFIGQRLQDAGIEVSDD